MEERGTIIASLVEDRGILKYRVNFIKENRVFGFLKPV
jgi:hypothetical protein